MIKQCRVIEVLNENKKTGNQVLKLIDSDENTYIAEGNPDFFSVDDDVLYFEKGHASPIASVLKCKFDPKTFQILENGSFVFQQSRCVKFNALFPGGIKSGTEIKL